MTTYFLLEISVEPTTNPEAVLTNAAASVKKGLQGTSGELPYMFRATGENVLFCIFKGNIGNAVKELNLTCGNLIRLTCTPLRKHEYFAQQILKADEKLTAPLAQPLKLEGNVFLLELRVEYRGWTMQQFLEMLLRESQAAYTARQELGMELDLFKVVGERRVFSITKGDVDGVDAAMFTLPVMAENGDQVQVKCRAIEAIE